MAERSYARLGYKNAQGKFQETPLRAMDIYTTDGASVEDHVSNAGVHITDDQAKQIAGAVQTGQLGKPNGVATLDSAGKVPAAQLPAQALTVSDMSVTDIPALLALSGTEAPLNTDVFVSDATGDATVKSGWGLYRRTAITDNKITDWTKLAEGEGLDVAMIDQTARDAAGSSQATAEAAQISANNAHTAANLLDAAYCEDETDMTGKNLRTGALVLMAVENESGE